MLFSATSLSFALQLSGSTERSHWTTWSSSPEDANTVESDGCHSTDVIGPECCLKAATGSPLRKNKI